MEANCVDVAQNTDKKTLLTFERKVLGKIRGPGINTG